MCGIAGVWPARVTDPLAVIVYAMTDTLFTRGPDAAGSWVDEAAGMALGHRRLAVLDLSPAGAQPMHSACSRYVLAFNGEIYNHLQLRAELESAGFVPAWRGHSDTETLLAAIAAWGLEPTLQRCVGMFAIALWDRKSRTLQLARDRFGEKPLYYGWTGKGESTAFVFASELKALKVYPGFAAPVCRSALTQYLRFMYVPAPRSIYQGVFKLEPGCLLTIQGLPPSAAPAIPLRPGQDYGSVSVRRWWALADVVTAGANNPISDEAEGITRLEQILKESVRLQSLADVPLGAFLSGGVDSSAIVALMQAQATRPVKTFCVGFGESAFDESPYARAIARQLGTDHNELIVTAAEAQSVIPSLPTMYDEPFADSSQIPMHLVSKAARQQVTVALSGDGGDELFGGYNRYLWCPRLWRRLAWLPYAVRQALGASIAAVPQAGWDALGRPINTFLPGSQGIANLGHKAHKLATRLNVVRNQDDLSLSMLSTWQLPDQVVRGERGPIVEPPSWLDPLPKQGLSQFQLDMMYRDSLTYLSDDILCKVDRAAMAVSLETRVPFLDHRVVELAWRLPLHMKVRGNEGKWALRQVLYKYVPRELIERPKAGFAIPVGEWLRGPLREWAEVVAG
jgi:asparagine synthase (glutamine-hydrolysing)